MILINREVLLSFEKMDADLCATCGEHHTAEDVIMMIKTAPTVDAVPVVRKPVVGYEGYYEAIDMAISALRQYECVGDANKALTLDELRQMDGEPVYCVEITGREEWLFRRDGGFADMYGEFTSDDFMVWDNYGKLWWCYRQKPEEDGHDERKENENV